MAQNHSGAPVPGDPDYGSYMAAQAAASAAQAAHNRGADPSAAAAAAAAPAGAQAAAQPANPGPVGDPINPPAPNNYLEDLWKQYGGSWFGPTYQGQNMPGLKDMLGQPGQAEKFYAASSDPSTDPYYQRQLQTGTDALNQQMAARGHGTGAAGGAVLGNFQAGLFANQYAQRAGLAKTAQDEGQARAGLLGQLGQAADATDTSRLQGAFGTAGQAQNLNMDRVNSYLDHVSGLDTSTAKIISDAFGKGGDISSEAGRAAIEAEIKGYIARAGGTQAQQDTAMKALAALWAAI